MKVSKTNLKTNSKTKILDLKKWYESDEFVRTQTYDGTDLGANYTKEATTFKVWAPIADNIKVCIYEKGTPAEAGDRLLGAYELYRGDRNVFYRSVSELGDIHGKFYTYVIETEGETVETADPYCVACGANSLRSMVVDLSKTNPEDWDEDKCPNIPIEEAVIYETHIKDFSYDENSGIDEGLRGRYLAFTVEASCYRTGNGESYPTCLSYLKRLGVTYVHLLPIADSGSIDEAELYENPSDKFNWGYDPMLYNVPEGQYATNPFDGVTRIREFKELVQALHRAGIGVIMDVVYNHTYHTDNPLHHTAPYYYHRIDENGEFSNGSGCGNETASEHIMYRRFMVNSILYWAKEYHIDGFRFDLMGLHDTETMNAIRAALNELPDGDKLLLYGEPWTAGKTAMAEGYLPAVTANEKYLMEGIHIFSDSIRDAIKGSVFEADEAAYVNSELADAAKFVDDIRAAIILPNRIAYSSAHDNYTLYDKLLLSSEAYKDKTKACINKYGEGKAVDSSVFERNEETAHMSRLAAGIYFTSAGIPFFQSGEEFLRTKYGLGDSYNASAKLNKLDWKRAYENRDIVEYYAKLIAMRKRYHELYHMSGENVVFMDDKNDKHMANIQFVVDKKLKVLYNRAAMTVEVMEYEADLDIYEKL